MKNTFRIITVKLIFIVLALSGCSIQSMQYDKHGSYQQKAEIQTKEFFREHPEYLSSRQKESMLFDIFTEISREPQYQNMDIYQMLEIAHEKVSVLIQFETNIS